MKYTTTVHHYGVRKPLVILIITFAVTLKRQLQEYEKKKKNMRTHLQVRVDGVDLVVGTRPEVGETTARERNAGLGVASGAADYINSSGGLHT